MLRVNFTGRLAAYRAVRRELLRAKGSALFLSSSVAKYGAKGLGLYAASLGALEAWARCEHLTMSKGGLRINVLSPGWVNSEMTADLRKDYREAAERWMPIGRFLDPEEVARKAIEILSSNVNGEVIEYLGD
jgi:3-oxoacyl-[acyl-carrier protein] reductase